MGSSPNETQHFFDKLTDYQQEKLELVKRRKARTVFGKKVLKRTEQDIGFSIDTGPSREVQEKVHEVLNKWANGKQFSTWISERLPLHLDLPVRAYPKDCFTPQVLVIGEGLPLMLLTLYAESSEVRNPNRSKEELQHEVREFCTKCARMLTLSLLNFCHREFILVPCTLAWGDDFTAEALQKEMEEQMHDAREYYGGPGELGKITCAELVRAVSIAATCTSVPCFMADETGGQKEWLLSMDRDWDRAMRHVINRMMDGLPFRVTYKTELKTKAAILEAAKRISCFQKVLIVTTDKAVHRTVKRLSEASEQEHGLDVDWLRSVHPGENIPQADRVIVIDIDDIENVQNVIVTVAQERHTELEQEEEITRVLLIGKSGSGKSSTANTLLGDRLFESCVSFAQVTTTKQVRRRKYGGREIEVVDSPGIFDVTRDKGIDCNNNPSYGHGSESELPLEFDVVCYVMKIERFTEEDDKVFQLLKDVLGDDVLRHVVIVFTHGDRIEQGETIRSILAQAPQRLQKIVEQCHNRYVVFDNTKSPSDPQVDAFFEMVTTINQSHHGERLRYRCPEDAEIYSRWERARTEDIQRRKSSLKFFSRG